MIRMDPAQQLHELEATRQKRQWRVSILNTRIYPQCEATLSSASARITEGATGRVFGIPFHVFDALTTEQLVTHIRDRLK